MTEAKLEATNGATVVPGPWTDAAPSVRIGPNLPDPLANWSRRQIFFACIWLADIGTALKLFLLCIGRFFDEDARSSSMSYKQVARECGIHESSAKRLAKAVVGDWLEVEIGKGMLTPRGPQNLYHGICPPDVVEDLRHQVRGVQGVSICDPNGDGVATGDPQGSHHATPNRLMGSPSAQMGSHMATRTTLTLKEREAAQGSPQETPHFNGAGFVISKRHVVIIPHETVEAWRGRYLHLPAIDVKLVKLGTQILNAGPKHKAWNAPAPWIEDILATDNKKAEQEAKVAEEKLSRAKGTGGSKRYAR